MTADDKTHFRLRFDSDIKEWLKERAKTNRRTMNAEINYRLQEARKAEATGQASQA